MPDTGPLVLLVVGALMVAGAFGTLLPLVPGLPLVWGGGLLYGVVEGFGVEGVVCLGFMTVVGAVGLAAGAALPHRRAVAAGVPRSSIVSGVALGVVGFFVIPVVGLAVGTAAGIWLAERRRLDDAAAAWAATRSTLVGFGLGALAQFAAAIVMIAIWVVWALLRG